MKNKISPPFKEVELDLMYNKAGFDATGDLLTLAEKYGIVQKAGAWYSYKNGKIGQGRENTKNYLDENLEVLEQIKADLIVFFSPTTTGEIPV